MIWVKNPEERSIHMSLKRRNSSSILGAHIFDSYLYTLRGMIRPCKVPYFYFPMPPDFETYHPSKSEKQPDALKFLCVAWLCQHDGVNHGSLEHQHRLKKRLLSFCCWKVFVAGSYPRAI